MTKVHISMFGLIFLVTFIYQPNWVYENFWSKVDFYESIPFALPNLVFLFVYAAISIAINEFGIRFLKKYV